MTAPEETPNRLPEDPDARADYVRGQIAEAILQGLYEHEQARYGKAAGDAWMAGTLFAANLDPTIPMHAAMMCQLKTDPQTNPRLMEMLRMIEMIGSEVSQMTERLIEGFKVLEGDACHAADE